MADARLVALVVTHNRLAQLKVTLARLSATPTDKLAAIVVFDNASDDGTAQWLGSCDDQRVVHLRSEVNGGGAGGFEQGMRDVVARLDPDWIVLMDDDARPEVGTIAAFHAADRSTYDAFAAAVRYPDGKICDMNRPWVNPFGSVSAFLRTLLRRRNGFHLPEAAYDGPQRRIEGASFVGLFLSREAIAKAGFPDGRLFIYGEDVLYTLGLTQAGGKMAFDPALTFEHDCGIASAHGVLSPLWKTYYYHRNQVFVIRAASGPVLAWPILRMRNWLWRARGRRYGAAAARYRQLLDLGLADGRAGKLDRPHSDILALSGAK